MIKDHAIRNVLSVLIVLITLAACQSSATVLAPTLTPTLTQTNAEDAIPPYQPTISVPTDLHLTGKLILADFHQGIYRFDFATQALTPIFQPPQDSFLSSAALSPDGRTFAIVYSPSMDISDPLYGIASLYTLPADGSGSPKPLLGGLRADYYYFSPWWSPDSESLYYGKLISPPLSGATPTQTTGYFLARYSVSQQTAQDLLRNVLAVRMSADGKKLFYVSLDPTTTLSNIYEADPNGSHAQSLLPGGESWIVDSLAVSPDGTSVAFSSADPTTGQSNVPWYIRLIGGGVAEAHAVPSDLWFLKIGGKPQQLTHFASNGIIEDFSPDGQYIVVSSGIAIYLIRPDGSGLTQILSDPVFASLQWMP